MRSGRIRIASGGIELRRSRAGPAADLRRERVPFEGAPRFGDRFPYFVNYVHESHDLIASHFGPGMAARLEAPPNTPASTPIWDGPYESPYGVHLVLVAAREPARAPALSEVRAAVTEDLRREQTRYREAALVRTALVRYRIETDR